MRKLLALVVVGAIGAGAAHGDILNFRSWLDANPSTPNSTANEWFGTRGVNGAMLTSNGSYWESPGFPNSTPLLASRANIGTHGGAAGPATFNGSFVHPGSGIAAVLVFSPTSPTVIGRVDVRSELVVNGLQGNGVTISVFTTISGTTTGYGSVTLAGTSAARFDSFNFPAALFQPGDRVHVVVGDRGSYLYDHVNLDAWIGIPTPGAVSAITVFGLCALRRRRR